MNITSILSSIGPRHNVSGSAGGIKRCTPPIRTISRHIECTTANDASATMTAHLVPSIDGHSAWMLRAGASAISRSAAEGRHAIVDRAVEKVNNLLTGAPHSTRDVTNDWNISAYWDDVDRANIREFIEVWSNFSPTFRVFGHDDILPLIAKYFPVYVGIFDAIRIPAAKADVARLILLYEFGGLYVDCHCGIRDKAGTSRLLFSLVEREAVFIDRRLAQEPRPPDEHFLINSIMLSQSKSKLILMIARQALATGNLNA